MDTFPVTAVLDLGWTVNELVQSHPSTLPVLNSLGIDSCCGGALTLTTVAQKHHLDPDVLRSALARAIRETAA